MSNRDIFDEEFDRINQNQSADPFDAWSNQAPNPTRQQAPKRTRIALIAIGMVICLVLGYVLAIVIQSGDYRQSLLDTVLTYMDESFLYAEQDNPDWVTAVESAGTELLQQAGDRYSGLMSPQSYYDYLNPVATTSGEIFGFSSQIVEGLGLLVGDVAPDTNTYGVLQSGDIIVKLENVKDKDGNAVVTNGSSDYLLKNLKKSVVAELLSATYSAKFYFLRNDVVLSANLSRGNVLVFPYKDATFEFVEFYFGDQHTNVSTTVMPGKVTCTKDERHLDRLPANTGYIRIIQFMDSTTSNVVTEFGLAMQWFKDLGLKRLVLDLKGNPGGNVDYVCTIASMLASSVKLSQSANQSLQTKDGYLITTLVAKDGSSSSEYRQLGYENYFGAMGEKCDVIIWTDQNSASASELLTGVLLDYGTAVQMGTRTYGKGIAQACIPLENYTGPITTISGAQSTGPWAIYFTFAKYLSPLGNNIHVTGYHPKEEYKADNYSDLWTKTIQYWG